MSIIFVKHQPPTGFERVGDKAKSTGEDNSTGKDNRFAIDMAIGGDDNELKPKKIAGGEPF